MSNDQTAKDTMDSYQTNTDQGDESTCYPQPAISPAPDHSGNDDTENPAPIRMATPQSPVQTEDSPEVTKDGTTEVRNSEENEGEGATDQVYREAKDGNL